MIGQNSLSNLYSRRSIHACFLGRREGCHALDIALTNPIILPIPSPNAPSRHPFERARFLERVVAFSAFVAHPPARLSTHPHSPASASEPCTALASFLRVSTLHHCRRHLRHARDLLHPRIPTTISQANHHDEESRRHRILVRSAVERSSAGGPFLLHRNTVREPQHAS